MITLSSVISGPVLGWNFKAVGEMAEAAYPWQTEVWRGGKELGTSYFPNDQLPDLLPPVRPHLLSGPSNLLAPRLDNDIPQCVGPYSQYPEVQRTHGLQIDHACFPETLK